MFRGLVRRFNCINQYSYHPYNNHDSVYCNYGFICGLNRRCSNGISNISHTNYITISNSISDNNHNYSITNSSSSKRNYSINDNARVKVSITSTNANNNADDAINNGSNTNTSCNTINDGPDNNSKMKAKAIIDLLLSCKHQQTIDDIIERALASLLKSSSSSSSSSSRSDLDDNYAINSNTKTLNANRVDGVNIPVFTHLQVMTIISSFSNMRPEDKRARKIILMLIPSIQQSSSPWNLETLEEQGLVVAALASLRGFSSYYEEIRALIQALLPLIPANPIQPLEHKDIARILEGINDMNTHHDGIMKLMEKLLPWIKQTKNSLRAMEIRSALYWLSSNWSLSSSSSPSSSSSLLLRDQWIAAIVPLYSVDDIDRTLSALRYADGSQVGVHVVFKIIASIFIEESQYTPRRGGVLLGRKVAGEWTIARVMTMLESLYKKPSNQPEILQFVDAIAKLLNRLTAQTSATVNAHVLCTGLHALRDISSDHEQVQRLCYAITQVVPRTRGYITSLDAFLAISGLRNCSTKHQVVLRLIEALVPLVERSVGNFSYAKFSKALLGLQRMSNNDSAIVAKLVDVLGDKLYGSLATNMSAEDIRSLLLLTSHLNSDTAEMRKLYSVALHHLSSVDIKKISLSDTVEMIKAITNCRGKTPETIDLVRELSNKLLRKDK